MTPLLLALALAAAPDLRPRPPHPDDTHCEKCHTTDGWQEVAFAHERTGFPLAGAHRRASCKACHAESFTRALGRDCGSCHRDVHQGRLGARCAGCHEETDWKTRFDADAHRRGNFPLVGRHAFIPCQECHGDRRDRGFSRPTPQCLACHQRDYDRTAVTAIDHRAAGFPTTCQQCHQPWRFAGAFFAQHEACFPIASGRHAGIRCLDCHTSFTGPINLNGQCNTGTAHCQKCHDCGRHPQVAGFGCFDAKCYQCHPGGNAGTSALRGGGSAALRRGGRIGP
ncbi:cytochrome c3 family protein [Anaeromyxobacter diazotrophicus]|uniref:Cytochrome c7-like domain-containing protein n=1 Tax=Anaeromyxobacter diazotrophicus TaxID=2590199 RepID=A0A7I9VQN1_9BACT|nr:cytochrome c3 family protein [Anaeromyxobacter diazotrophicus]GEJ58568.1 hypothetical protein AMYX_33090 [Anaeromyxobacter diazotrophicus]